MFCLQSGLQMKCLHHFQVNDELSKPIEFHDYQLAHTRDMEYQVYRLLLNPQLVHTVVHPCHVSIGIHIDQDSICLDQLDCRSLQVTVHCVLQIADTLDQVRQEVSSHKQCMTNLYALYV